MGGQGTKWRRNATNVTDDRRTAIANVNVSSRLLKIKDMTKKSWHEQQRLPSHKTQSWASIDVVRRSPVIRKPDARPREAGPMDRYRRIDVYLQRQFEHIRPTSVHRRPEPDGQQSSVRDSFGHPPQSATDNRVELAAEAAVVMHIGCQHPTERQPQTAGLLVDTDSRVYL